MEERCAFLEEETPRIEAAIALTEGAVERLRVCRGDAAAFGAGGGSARPVGCVYGGVGRADDAVGRGLIRAINGDFWA